ncbi:MAG: Rrf2 family transcriptional regulator [Dehalococcoidales bacterium]|nr:Rrf2 family transcriptional regulator [Dehalococcoidales bacterium]
MWLNQREDCAVRLMVDLACLSENTRTTVKEVARRQKVPERFMAKIVTQAVAAGLVETYRGTGGGLALAGDAESVTLLEIVESAGRPVALTRCTSEPSRCPLLGRCAVLPVWDKAQRQLKELLASTTLAELAQAQKKLERTD